MNTNQPFVLFISEDFRDFIKVLGGLGVIFIAIITFVGNIIFQKIVSALQGKSNKEIELLKAEISQRNSRELEMIKAVTSQNGAFISNLGSNHSATYQKLISKRIEIIEHYWQCILKVRDSVPGAVYMAYQMLSDDELTVDNINKIRFLREAMMDTPFKDASSDLIQQSLKIDEVRPFISSKLWILKYAYIGLLGRTMVIISEGYKRGLISFWKNDELVLQFFKLVLTEQEITHVMGMKVGGIQYVTDLMESKIIDEMTRFISNDDFINDSVEQFKRTEAIEILKRKGFIQG